MKKFLAMLLALVMALSLVACGEKKDDTNEGGDTATGSVYYLNFKPESDAAWQDSGCQPYTAETGVPVKVLTAASGQYNATLTAEMDKPDGCSHHVPGAATPGAVNSYGEFCYNLDGHRLSYKQMTTHDFDLEERRRRDRCPSVTATRPSASSSTRLCWTKAGHSLDEITNFESLKAVADDIHARASELGFDAFTSAGLDGSSAWRFSGHLANMPLFYEFRDDNVTAQPATIKGTYLDNYKNIWDLYTTDTATTGAALLTATGDQAEAEFGQGKAVFYQNGSWEYSNLVIDETKGFKMNPADLAMIPIYCGVEGEEKAGLCCGTENCWAVNKNASEEDIKATLDFMNWVVTSDAGTTMLAEQFGPCPFKNAKTPENVFFAQANEYVANGNYTVTWAFNWTPAVDDWRAAVVDALSQYTTSNGSWDNVKTAFVEGWATQYANEH